MYVLYWNSTHKTLSNSDARCRLIVGFSDEQFTESNPGSAQVNRAISPTEQEKEWMLNCKTHAVNADDPSGAFLVPDVSDQTHSFDCGH